MLRLGIVIVVASLLGIGGGMLQYNLSYKNIDERFADFRAQTTQVAAVENSDSKVASDKLDKLDQLDKVDRVEKAPKVSVPGGTTHDFGTMQQGSKDAHVCLQEHWRCTDAVGCARVQLPLHDRNSGRLRA